MSEDFKIWWHNEGSGMPPFKEEETCDHVERVSAIAWSNGAFKATLFLEAENARLKAEVERLNDVIKEVVKEAQENSDRYVRRLNEEAAHPACVAMNRKLGDANNEIHRLKAELARLRASSFVTAVPVEEYEKLKAEVERLRKAGDWMYNAVILNSDMEMDKAMDAWNAAKEGKQP